MAVSDKGRCKRKDCKYYDKLTKTCCYAIATGVSRTFRHLGENVDINKPCREYEKGARNIRVSPYWMGSH